jgi:predicted RNA-binding Zn-ribbon protein involved in translation (DUF1610 family)
MKFLKKLWKKYLKFKKKSLECQGHMNSFSQLTDLECPKCKAKLYQLFNGRGGFPNNYVCRKCSYVGAFGIERFEKKEIKKVKSVS